MLHFLTLGLLDPDAVRSRQIVAVRPLLQQPIDEVADWVSANSSLAATSLVQVTSDCIRLPWWVPERIRPAELLALKLATEFGLIVADIEHGRVVALHEL